MDLTQDYFSNFNIDKTFEIDTHELAQRYRNLQQVYHPDRFVNADATQKRIALQTTAYINSAYHKLKSPLGRALYLLELEGINPLAESNTQMPNDFLMQQIEWREDINFAKQEKDLQALDSIRLNLKQEAQQLTNNFAHEYSQKNWDIAQTLVRKLQFIYKLQEEITQVHAYLLD